MAQRVNDIGVKWGWQERVLEVFSAKAARRRYADRISSNQLRRAYDGASKGRLKDGWRTSATSADAEIAASGSLLRDRMRDLVRNNPLAAQAVQVLVNNMVGDGIRPRAKTGDPEADKKINDLFEKWSKGADAHGHTDFYGLQALAVREMIEGGDLFGMKRPRKAVKDLPIRLQVELFEADHLDDSRQDYRNDDTRIDQGIEYDRNGRRAAYWMFPDHPGGNTSAFRRKFESVRIPADRVAHLFERQRVQSRGVPWGVPAMTAMRDLDDWRLAEMVRKKTEACLVAVVLSHDPSDPGVNVEPGVYDSEGQLQEKFSPGMIANANGKDIKFNSPAHTGGIREWNIVQIQAIAAGWRVPYPLISSDFSQANFSSNRAGLNEFRRMVTEIQWHVIIPMFCQRIWDWFCEAAWTAGLIPSASIPVEWAPPKFESVNPWQDAQTDLLETRAGFSSLAQQIGKRGWDMRTTLEEYRETNEIVDGLGLVLDSDPRKVTRQGMFQSEPQDGSTDTEGDGPPDPKSNPED